MKQMKQKNIITVFLMCSLISLAVQHFVLTLKPSADIQISYIPLLVAFLSNWANEKGKDIYSKIIKWTSIVLCMALFIGLVFMHTLVEEELSLIYFECLKKPICILIAVFSAIQTVCCACILMKK